MATRVPPLVPLGEEPGDAALQQAPWRMRAQLSSVADAADAFLARASFDRGPWLAAGFAAGIAAWFALPDAAWWVGTIAAAIILALGPAALWRGDERRAHLLVACVSTGIVIAAGVMVIWARSELVGAPPLERTGSMTLAGKVLERIEQPADARVRLVLATRGDAGEPIKVRVNVPLAEDDAAFREGAVVRLRARLMPPAPPMLPVAA